MNILLLGDEIFNTLNNLDRVVKMERTFTNLLGYLWFLLPNLMEKKDPELIWLKNPSLDGGRSDFKMAAVKC